MEMNSVITIKNLVKSFPVGSGFFTALKGVELILMKAEFTGLIGPSGSGKTTLLNIIGGLDSPTEGQVSVLGHALDNTSHNERAMLRKEYMGFIFQDPNVPKAVRQQRPFMEVYPYSKVSQCVNDLSRKILDEKQLLADESSGPVFWKSAFQIK